MAQLAGSHQHKRLCSGPSADSPAPTPGNLPERGDWPERDDWSEIRATARPPNLDVGILHRRAWEGDAEQLRVTLQATPSFAGALPLLAAASPLLMSARMMQAAWAAWLAMAGPGAADRRPGRE